MILKHDSGVEVAEYDGYVPDFMPGKHYGDYIILEIDAATGKILNWKPPTDEEIEEVFAPKNEEDYD